MEFKKGDLIEIDVADFEGDKSLKYISYWDGCDEIETNAKINIYTGNIVDIETVEVGDEYEICTAEFIKYDDGSMEQVILKDDGRRLIVSKSGELFKTLEIHNVKYTILKEMTENNIHTICGVAY